MTPVIFPELPSGYEGALLWLTPLNNICATCPGKPDLMLAEKGWVERSAD